MSAPDRGRFWRHDLNPIDRDVSRTECRRAHAVGSCIGGERPKDAYPGPLDAREQSHYDFQPMRFKIPAVLLTGLMFVLPEAARANVPFNSITSTTSPLTLIGLGNEGSDQIQHSGDATTGELYPPGAVPADSGTFLVMNGRLYAPNFAQHNGSATGSIGVYTAWTPISQTATTGLGTMASPYQVITVYTAGATGITITQTDTYIKGTESYTTHIHLVNTGTLARDYVLFRAGDCYLGGSDSGYGLVDQTTGSIRGARWASSATCSSTERSEERERDRTCTERDLDDQHRDRMPHRARQSPNERVARPVFSPSHGLDAHEAVGAARPGESERPEHRRADAEYEHRFLRSPVVADGPCHPDQDPDP
jgi:hypothetical protein